jgi:hypothetical protein
MEDQTSQGQTLVLDSTTALETPAVTTPDQDSRKMLKATPEMVMKFMRDMMSNGKLTPRQAQELRKQLGVTKNFFTKKKVDPAKKKRRKQIAEASRRRNRYTGATKGQKVTA